MIECAWCEEYVGDDDTAPWLVVEEAEDLGWSSDRFGWYCPRCKSELGMIGR